MAVLMFGSDNAVGVSAEVMAAIASADHGYAIAYGDDDWTRRLNAAYSEFFGRESFVFPVGSGTAANALALAAIAPSYGEIVCHERAHVFTTEAGAPEFFSGGARLVPLPGADEKLLPDGLQAYLDAHSPPNRHHMVPAAVSLSQATEAGRVYTVAEIEALADLAHHSGMRVHMDGARFANALTSLNVEPAAISWRAGIDVLSLGTTKNGTMNAEAVITFDVALARELAIRQKRAGLLTSKMRYVSAQLLQMLEGRLWERNARRANETASELSRILLESDQARLLHPVQTNQIFVELSDAAIRAIGDAGLVFRRWGMERCYRLVTSFRTTTGELDSVRRALLSLSGDNRQAI